MDVEDLSLPRQFPPDGVSNEIGIESHDLSPNGQASRRRRVDGRQIAYPGKRHVQRARNGGGRERQDVDVRAKLFEPFLMADAEPLLLINNDQSQILELHPLLQKPMRADDDVDDARREVG